MDLDGKAKDKARLEFPAMLAERLDKLELAHEQLSTENTALQQRVHQLEQAKATLESYLEALPRPLGYFFQLYHVDPNWTTDLLCDRLKNRWDELKMTVGTHFQTHYCGFSAKVSLEAWPERGRTAGVLIWNCGSQPATVHKWIEPPALAGEAESTAAAAAAAAGSAQQLAWQVVEQHAIQITTELNNYMDGMRGRVCWKRVYSRNPTAEHWPSEAQPLVPLMEPLDPEFIEKLEEALVIKPCRGPWFEG